MCACICMRVCDIQGEGVNVWVVRANKGMAVSGFVERERERERERGE